MNHPASISIENDLRTGPQQTSQLMDQVGLNLLARRKLRSKVFECACFLAAFLTLAVLLVLLVNVLYTGLHWVDFQFFTSFSSRIPEQAGIVAGIVGSLWLLGMTALFAVPVGVGAGIYLEEIAVDSRARRFLDVNIRNLAGVPSIVYGILGLAFFVRYLGFDRSILSASMTLALLILPMIIMVTRESLKAVPEGIRHAAFAVGASKWQCACAHILPSASPGILTGIILSVSRAIGETAPLILVGGLAYVAFLPEGVMDEFTALPLMIYNWAERPQEEFHQLAAAGIIVLLVVLLTANAVAILLRNKFQKLPKC